MRSIFLVTVSFIIFGMCNSANAGPPAARLSDLVTCPLVTGNPPIPHAGGPISGLVVPSVLMGGLPAARLGSLTVEVGAVSSITQGSNTVLIGGFPAARMGDITNHGGVIINGLPSVLIGG